MKKKYNVDDFYFENIDTQDKAYILGLFYADGCNYENNNTIKIDLQEEDEELLLKIKNALQYTGELKYYEQPDKYFPETDKYYKCKSQIRLCIISYFLSKDLADKGCVNNKTYILTFPNENILPLELQRHFIRGYFDGDGSLSCWIDNKNTGHKKFNLNFCGTSDIIRSISNIFANKFNCYPSIVDRYPDRNNNNLQFSIDGNRKINEILDWLYKDANIYMERKYNKYLELIEEIKRVDNNDILYGNAYKRRPVINLITKEFYETVNGAAKSFGVKGSTIYTWCHKHINVMYLDEYEQIDNKNSIINNKIIDTSIKVYCIETDKYYNSIKSANEDTGVSQYTIKRQCDGYTTRNNTYHFKYA